MEDNGLCSTVDFNSGFSKLTLLNMKNNLLNELSPNIGDLICLEDLNLSENKLTKLPIELSKCIHLISLDLHYNKLASLPKELCTGLVNLQILKLSINQLTELPCEITFLQKLKVFHVRYNLITDLPDTDWYNMESLEEFNIANNNLSTLPIDLTEITTLRGLSICGNPFKDNELSELAQKGESTAILAYLKKQVGQTSPKPKTKKVIPMLATPILTAPISISTDSSAPMSIHSSYSTPPSSINIPSAGKNYGISPRNSSPVSTTASSSSDKGSVRKTNSFISTWKSKKSIRNPPPKEYTYALASPRGMVFGVSIDHNNVTIPLIIEKCIKYLENGYMDTEGLFRISGNADDISDAKRSFDTGKEVNFNEEKNPHNVASLLKLYLREIPEPLFTYERYDDFIKASASSHGLKDRLAGLRKLTLELPPFNKTVLEYLVRFLHQLSKRWKINKMTPSNLAIVFAPNLLYPKEREMMKLMEENFHSNGIMESVIEQFNYIFGFVDEIESSQADLNVANVLKSTSNT